MQTKDIVYFDSMGGDGNDYVNRLKKCVYIGCVCVRMAVHY